MVCSTYRSAGAVALCAGLGMAMTSGAARGAQVTASWLNPASGSWTDAAMWSTAPTFPNNETPVGTSYHAVIDAAGAAYTVTLSQSVAVSSLTMDSFEATLALQNGHLSIDGDSVVTRGRLALESGVLTGAGALTVSDRFEWAGGDIASGGTLRIDQGGHMQLGPAATRRLGRTMLTEGVVDWQGGGDLFLDSGLWINSGLVTIDVAAGATQRVLSEPQAGFIANTGTFVKTGEGTLEFGSASPMGETPFLNSGVFHCQAGVADFRLQLQSSSSGAYLVDAGAKVLFRTGTTLTPPTIIEGDGSVSFYGRFDCLGTVAIGGVLTSTAETSASTSTGRFDGSIAADRVEVLNRFSATRFNGPVSVQSGVLVSGAAAYFEGPLELHDSQLDVFGTVVYNHTEAPLAASSIRVEGSIDGAGEALFTGVLDWHGGRIALARTTLAEGAVATTVVGRPITQVGVFELDGSMTLRSSALIGGSLHVNGDLVVDSSAGSIVVNGGGAILNHGSMILEGGSLKFQGPGLSIVNEGDLWIRSGEVTVENAALSGGPLRLDAGAALRFAGAGDRHETIFGGGSVHFISGVNTLRSDASIDGPVSVTSGTLTIESGASVGSLRLLQSTTTLHAGALLGDFVLMNNAVASLVGDVSLAPDASCLWTGGKFVGTGSLKVLDSFEISGASEKDLEVMLENAGSGTWAGGDLFISSGRQLLNSGELAMAPASGVELTLRGPGRLVNTGVLTVQGAGLVTTEGGNGFVNSGLVRVLSGTLAVDTGVMNSGEIFVDNGGAVVVNNQFFGSVGRIYGGGDLTLVGGSHTVAPGGVEVSGKLVVSGASVALETFPMHSLRVLSGTVTAVNEVAVAGRLEWSSGALNGPAEFRVAAGGEASLFSGGKTLGGLLVNDGDLTWASGSISIANGTLINNGVFTATSAANVTGSGNGAIINNGEVRGRSAGTATFGSSGSLVFQNNGSVVVEEGALAFLRTLINEGTIEVLRGATLRLGGTVTQGVAGSITGSGTVDFVSGTHTIESGFLDTTGAIRISGGTVHYPNDEFIEQLILGGGSLGGGGGLTLGGLQWLSGSMLAGGDATVGESGTLTLGADAGARTLSRTLVSAGAADLAAGALTINGGLFENTGSFVLNGGASILGAGAGGTVVNGGALSTTGAGVVTIGGVGLTLVNSGSIEVGQGASLRLSASVGSGDLGQITGAGAIDFGGGAVVVEAGELQTTGGITISGGDVRFRATPTPLWWSFTGGDAVFEEDFEAGSLFLTTGTRVRFEGALLTGPTSELRITGLGSVELAGEDMAAMRLTLQGGALLGERDLVVTQQLSWTGGSMSGAGQTIVQSDATAVIGFFAPITLSRQLDLHGGSTWSAAILRMNAGILRNDGTFTATALQGNTASMIGLAGGGVFVNDGILVKQGAGEMRLFRDGGDMALVNTGVVEVREGRLRLLGADATSNGGLYDIRHSAMVEVEGAFENEGGAALAFEVGGMKERGLSGLMTITGEATLAGTLVVSTPEPFSAAWGDRWTIMTYGSLVGDFDSFDLPTEGFAARGDSYGVSDLRWYAAAGATEYVVGVSHIADIDHDGLIGFSDLNVIVSNFNTLGGWALGDVDGDGFVGFADLNLVASLFNVSAPRSVPAPGGVVVLGLAAAAGLRRRREGNRS